MKSSSRHHHKPSSISNFFAAMLRPAALLVMLLVLVACGNNNTGASVARVEIVQTGLLFTERGQTRQLSARVFDAAGVPIDTPVRWSSSDANNISVASNGTAVAERSIGSTQITASVGEVRSSPLLAVVTTVAAGTVLVSDEQITRGVVESDPNAAPSLDNTYTVVVSGIPLPAVDALMVGTGSAPVAGRVVSAREVEGGVEVTLKLAPLSVLFPGLEINQRFNLADVPATIPDSVNAGYTVQREGNTYTFTPRPEARAFVAKAGGVPVGRRTLFQGCEGSFNGIGVGDGAAPPFVFEPQPVFTFTIAPALDVVYTQARGLERFVVTAEPTFLIDGTVKATVAFEGKVSCKAELLIFPVPVGGALSVVISGLVPVGVGFELAGKVTVAQMKLGLKSRTSAKAALGLSCESECSLVNELTDFVNTNTPTVDVASTSDFRIKPEFTAFGYVEAAIGNRFFKSLQFKAFEIKAGPKLEGEFAPLSAQIAATDFKSNYKLSLVINAGFGDDIESALNILGVVEVGNEVLEKGIDLAASPTGVLTADRDRFIAGDTVKFELKLDPVAVKFLGLYNIKEIVLIRNSGLREIARVAASGEQTTFNFTFIAPDEGRASEFTAFAVTSLLPADVLSLELGAATAAVETNTAPVAVNDSAIVVMGSAATTILVLANDSDADGDALTLSAVSQPTKGNVSIVNAGKALSYRPATGFSGAETFGYTVIDGKGGSDEGRVTVQVQAGPSSLRVTNAQIGSRADAIDCLIVRNGVCASPAPLFQTNRFYNETTGIPGSDQTSEEAGANFDGMNVSVETEGSFAVSGLAGNSGQIELRCTAAGSGTGSGGRSDVAYGANSASGSSVNFNIQGEGGLRYEISVDSSASGASPPDQLPAGSIKGGLTDHFEVRHTGSDGRSEIGESTGFLEAGFYTLEISCFVNARREGGSWNGAGVVRLSLHP